MNTITAPDLLSALTGTDASPPECLYQADGGEDEGACGVSTLGLPSLIYFNKFVYRGFMDGLARDLEFHETPAEATRALLEAEIFTPRVWDCCCGRGAIAEELIAGGYDVVATDVYDWGYGDDRNLDFLATDQLLAPTIICNPPFSHAVEFLEHAWSTLGARKIAMFQRWAWWESADRVHGFWPRHPPNRIYGFDLRATCWRGSIPEEERTSSSTTAHAWYIFERNQPIGTLAGHLRLAAPANDPVNAPGPPASRRRSG